MMIRFANPKRQRQAAGGKYLLLTEAGTWESFPEFAKNYTEQIGAKVIRKVEGPDMHLWEIEYEGASLRLVYDDFPNGVTVESNDNGGQEAIDKLYEIATQQSEPTGL